MTKFLKLPVYFASGDPEELEKEREEAEALGIPYKEKKERGDMYVALPKIAGFNKDSDGRTTVEFINGYRQAVMMKFEDFVDMVRRADGEIIE